MKLNLSFNQESFNQEAIAEPGLKEAMRNLTGGVCVVTAGSAEQRTGLTVTTATCFSTSPPTMLIQVNRSSSSYSIIRHFGHFCVNILAGHQRHIADRFTGLNGVRGTERYAGADWSTLTTGALALDRAIANIDCQVEEFFERHSHAIILGRVRDVRLGNTQASQLVYQRGGYGIYPSRQPGNNENTKPR
jgi:flavin reductase (DIM6/NTAB) family NADH-FMN oxidoreductase RutF